SFFECYRIRQFERRGGLCILQRRHNLRIGKIKKLNISYEGASGYSTDCLHRGSRKIGAVQRDSSDHSIRSDSCCLVCSYGCRSWRSTHSTKYRQNLSATDYFSVSEIYSRTFPYSEKQSRICGWYRIYDYR